VGGKDTALFLVGIDEVAIDPNLKNAVMALSKFWNYTKPALYRSRQNGGLRDIASLKAVCDLDLYGIHIMIMQI
jgi:hypothetical protein